MAERASAALGCSSLTEYMVRLIRDNAPQVLEQESSIQVTNTHFDNFLAICNDVELMPSDRIMAAAKRLDSERF